MRDQSQSLRSGVIRQALPCASRLRAATGVRADVQEAECGRLKPEAQDRALAAPLRRERLLRRRLSKRCLRQRSLGRRDNGVAAAGIGKDQITLNAWSLELGGHCRTGLEDNVRLDRERLAPSNAALVKRVVELCDRYGRRPATVREARKLLKLAA
jgi:hypothetical protein